MDGLHPTGAGDACAQQWSEAVRATIISKSAINTEALAKLQRFDFNTAFAFDNALEKALEEATLQNGPGAEQDESNTRQNELKARLDGIFDRHIGTTLQYAERCEEYLALLGAIATTRCPDFVASRPECTTLMRSLPSLRSGQDNQRKEHRDAYACAIAVGKAWGFDKLRHYNWTERGHSFMMKMRACSNKWPKWEQAAVVLSLYGAQRLDLHKPLRRDPQLRIEPQDIAKAKELASNSTDNIEESFTAALRMLSEYRLTLDTFGLLDYNKDVAYKALDSYLRSDVSISSESGISSEIDPSIFDGPASPFSNQANTLDTPLTLHSDTGVSRNTPESPYGSVGMIDKRTVDIQAAAAQDAALDTAQYQQAVLDFLVDGQARAESPHPTGEAQSACNLLEFNTQEAIKDSREAGAVGNGYNTTEMLLPDSNTDGEQHIEQSATESHQIQRDTTEPDNGGDPTKATTEANHAEEAAADSSNAHNDSTGPMDVQNHTTGPRDVQNNIAGSTDVPEAMADSTNVQDGTADLTNIQESTTDSTHTQRSSADQSEDILNLDNLENTQKHVDLSNAQDKAPDTTFDTCNTQENEPDLSGTQEDMTGQRHALQDMTDTGGLLGTSPVSDDTVLEDFTIPLDDTGEDLPLHSDTQNDASGSSGNQVNTTDLGDAAEATKSADETEDIQEGSSNAGQLQRDCDDTGESGVDLTDTGKMQSDLDGTEETPTESRDDNDTEDALTDSSDTEATSISTGDTQQDLLDSPGAAARDQSDLSDTEDEDAPGCKRHSSLERTWEDIAGQHLKNIRHAMTQAINSSPACSQDFVPGQVRTKRRRLGVKNSDVDLDVLRTGLHWLGDIQYARTNTNLQSPNAGDVLVVNSSKDFVEAAEATSCLQRCVLIRERPSRTEIERYLDKVQPLPTISFFFREMTDIWGTHKKVNVQSVNIQEDNNPTVSMRIGEARAIFKARAGCQEYRRALNLLDLRQIVTAGPPAFFQESRFGALTHILQNLVTGPGKEGENSMPSLDRLSRCRSFNILALGGAFSGPHVDVLNGTWVRCLEGLKAWIIKPVLTKKERQEFVSQGHTWRPSTPGKIVILQKGDILVMPPGLLAVHAPLTLTPCLMEGGMFWDWDHLDRIFRHAYWICSNSDVTNEVISASKLDTLLKQAIFLVDPKNEKSTHRDKDMKLALDAIYNEREKMKKSKGL